AEQLLSDGIDDVTLVTPYGVVGAFSSNTLEQPRIQARLIACGIKIVTCHNCVGVENGQLILECAYTGRRSLSLDIRSLVTLSARIPRSALYDELMAMPDRLEMSGVTSVEQAGDCVAPSTIAAAVHAGTTVARNFDIQGSDA